MLKMFSLCNAPTEHVASIVNSKRPSLPGLCFVPSPQCWRIQAGLPKTADIVFIPFYFSPFVSAYYSIDVAYKGHRSTAKAEGK